MTQKQNAKEAVLKQDPEKTKPLTAYAIRGFGMNLDDDQLSHGETPHYHRRCIVSLLSSGWDQVVPMLYGRQEIWCRGVLRRASEWVCDAL